MTSSMEQYVLAFHEKSRLLFNGRNKSQIKEAESFFDNLKKKVPLGFDVCHATLFSTSDGAELLFCSQLLCWYCKHNNLSSEQFEFLVNAVNSFANLTFQSVLTQLLLSCSAAICRQFISSALLGRTYPICAMINSATNFPIDICIQLLSFIPELITNRELWQGLKGTASYSEENAQKLIRCLLADTPNIVESIDFYLKSIPPNRGYSGSYGVHLPMEVLNCSMQWMQLQISVVTSPTAAALAPSLVQEEQLTWCRIWKSTDLLSRISHFLDTLAAHPESYSDKSICAQFQEASNVLSAYCCLSYCYDEHHDFSVNFERTGGQFPPRQLEFMQSTVLELLPFLSRLLSASLENSRLLFSEFRQAILSGNSFRGISLWTDLEVLFESTCIPFTQCVTLCCNCVSPMLLMLAPLLKEDEKYEYLGQGNPFRSNDSSSHSSALYQQWSDFLSSLASSVSSFVNRHLGSDASIMNALPSNFIGGQQKLVLVRTLEVLQRRQCMQLMESVQVALMLPAAKIQQELTIASRQLSGPGASNRTGFGGFGNGSGNMLNGNTTKSDDGRNPAIAACHPLLLYTLQQVVTTCILTTRCLGECSVEGDGECELEEYITDFRTSFRDNMREVSTASSGFLLWILQSSMEYISPLVGGNLPNFENFPVSCAIEKDWAVIESQLHACTAVTKNVLELLRNCFHEDEKKALHSGGKSTVSSPQVLKDIEMGKVTSTPGLLLMTARLLHMILHDNIAFCRPASRMVVLLTSDLIPELQLLLKDKFPTTGYNGSNNGSNSPTSSPPPPDSSALSLDEAISVMSQFAGDKRFIYEKVFTALALKSLRAVLMSLVLHREEKGEAYPQIVNLIGENRRCGWHLPYRTKQDHIGAVGLMKLVPAVVALPRAQLKDAATSLSTAFANNSLGFSQLVPPQEKRVLTNCNPAHAELALSQCYLLVQHTENFSNRTSPDLHLVRQSFVDMVNLLIQPENPELMKEDSVLPLTVSAILSSYWHILFTTKLMTCKASAQMTVKSFVIAQEASAAALALLHIGNNRDASQSLARRSPGDLNVFTTMSPLESIVLSASECQFVSKCFVCAVGQVLGPFVASILFNCVRKQHIVSKDKNITELREAMYSRLVYQLLRPMYAVSPPSNASNSSPLLASINSNNNSSNNNTNRSFPPAKVPVLSKKTPSSAENAESENAIPTIHDLQDPALKYGLEAVIMPQQQIDETSLAACHWLGERLGLLAESALKTDPSPVGFSRGFEAKPVGYPSQLLLPHLSNIFSSINTTWKSKVSARDVLPCFDAKLQLVEEFFLPLIEMLLTDCSTDTSIIEGDSTKYDYLLVICQFIGANVNALQLTPAVTQALTEYNAVFADAQSSRLSVISRLFGRLVNISNTVLNLLSDMPQGATLSTRTDYCSAIAMIGVKLAENIMKSLCTWQPLANISDIYAQLFQSVSSICWRCVLMDNELSNTPAPVPAAVFPGNMSSNMMMNGRPTIGSMNGLTGAVGMNNSWNPVPSQAPGNWALVKSKPSPPPAAVPASRHYSGNNTHSSRHNDNTATEHHFTASPGCAAGILVDFWYAGMFNSNLNINSPNSTPSSSKPSTAATSNPRGNSPAIHNGVSHSNSHLDGIVPNGHGSSNNSNPNNAIPKVPFLQGCGAEMYCAVVDAITGFIIAESSPLNEYRQVPPPLLQLCPLKGSSRTIATWKTVLSILNMSLGSTTVTLPHLTPVQQTALYCGQHCEMYALGDPEVVNVLLTSQRIVSVTKAVLYGLAGNLDPLLRDQLSRTLQKLFVVFGAQTASAAVTHVMGNPLETRSSPFESSQSSRQQRLALGNQLQVLAIEGNWKKFKVSLKILIPKTTGDAAAF